ncbi:MAG: aspartate carbamoyltransferase regulatory subunit [Candidatus Bilamarchaeaceae archaeon]
MLTVDTIENGTVVDHIRAGMGRKVLYLMGIDQNYPHRVALMINVPSKKMGKKDILKIEGILVSDEKTNLIALVSPKATVNHIQGGKVVKKSQAELPERICGVGKCPNPKCITNAEKVQSRFAMEPGDGYRCGYCERRFAASELV